MLAWTLLSALVLTAFTEPARGEERHKVIVVGAGVSGFTAAVTLLEHNVTDLIVLEASERIGGRIRTWEFEGHPIEEGAEFVHGEEDNAVHELVSPHNLLTSYKPLIEGDKDIYSTTSGRFLNNTYVNKLVEDAYEILSEHGATIFNGSLADYFFPRLEEFLAYHKVEPALAEALRFLIPHIECVPSGSDSLEELGASGYAEYTVCEGDNTLKWKTGGYKTLFDILSKKFPNPAEELPVANKILFRKEVTRIEHNDEGVEVKCADGSTYLADHVIVTVSLGVLKKHAASIFHPELPADKTAAIESLGIGCVGKVFLLFPIRWWPVSKNVITPIFSNKDLEDFKAASDYGYWIANTSGFEPVMNNDRMLCVWFSGEACRIMERLSEENVTDGVMDLLSKSLGDTFEIPRPAIILKTNWASNPYTLGSYSYRTVNSDKNNLTNDNLAAPVLRGDKPVLMFAGEATHRHYYSTVHGALATGRREANRLISYLNKHA